MKIVKIIEVKERSLVVFTGTGFIDVEKDPTHQYFKKSDMVVFGYEKDKWSSEKYPKFYTYKELGYNHSFADFYYRAQLIVSAGTTYESYLRKKKIRGILQELKKEGL